MLTCEESKRQLYEGIIAGRPIPELETILWDAVVAYQNQQNTDKELCDAGIS